LAYRTDFDLSNHQKHSGVNLEYTDPKTGEKFVPHVIEPTFGVERTVLAVLCDAYEEVEGGRQDGQKEGELREVVLHLDKKIAPVKIAVFPLIKKEPLILKAREIVSSLRRQLGHRQNFVISYDESGTIGRRYRRQDEIGTPYCVTVDFESLEDGSVTIRDRDTMKQERVKIEELVEWVGEKYV
jgi:glycyl-tRNA synthetase